MYNSSGLDQSMLRSQKYNEITSHLTSLMHSPTSQLLPSFVAWGAHKSWLQYRFWCLIHQPTHALPPIVANLCCTLPPSSYQLPLRVLNFIMVRTRKQDYTGDVMQQEHRQARQPTRTETVRKVGRSKADHIGKRNSGMLFSVFQRLPCELRLMVWEAAMAPRLVAVIPRPCPKDHDLARDRKNREISLLRGIPALLAVNQEARHVALRHYTWRFTIDITISTGFPWSPLDAEHRRARVVMSPDDTLGLFRCKQSWRERVRISRFDVKIANDKRNPWRIHPTTDAPKDGFKKVAILGDAVESNLHIVRALNITLWDLDSILHSESEDARTASSPHTKHKILLESAKMIPKHWKLVRASPNNHHLVMDRNGQSLDVLALKFTESQDGTENWKDFLDLLSRPRRYR